MTYAKIRFEILPTRPFGQSIASEELQLVLLSLSPEEVSPERLSPIVVG